jgi:hypothetical protein
MTGYTNPYAGMTKAELEAQFTKEDPRYPARKAASEALHAHVKQWIEEYEYDDGESGCHMPNELEQMLIFDAFYGLTADEDYVRLHDAWRSLCGPLPQPDLKAEALRALLNAMPGTEEHVRAVSMAQQALATSGVKEVPRG